MKRAQPKQSSTTKTPKKQTKVQNKINLKLRDPSTIGSRSSMDSKFTKRKLHTEDKVKTCRIDMMKQRGSMDQYQIDNQNKMSRFALKLQENKGQESHNEGLVSFREYCMVGDRWIPLLTSTQRQRIKSNKMIETTSLKLQQAPPNSQPKIKQKSNITQTLQKLKQEIQHNKQQLQEIPIQTKYYYYNILKNAISKFDSDKQEQVSALRNITNNSPRDLIEDENTIRSQKSYRLQKNKSSDKENRNDTSIGDCSCSDSSLNQPQINQKQTQQQPGNNADDHSPVKNLKFDQNIQPSMEDMIKLRQLRQMAILITNNEQTQTNQSSHTKINTSIICISRYIKNILFVIKQSNFTGQILNNLKLAWGYQKIEKLGRIRHKKYLGSTMDVLPEYLFEYVEDYSSKNNLYEFMHNKCIFDCLNYELNKLKPFYQSNGQTFPWNFKMSSPLTFFQIDEKSLALAFEEIKIKMLEFSSLLCGLLVQTTEQHHQFHLLVKRRHQKQNMMLKKYNEPEQNQNLQDNAIENQAILILEDVTTSIFTDLIAQFLTSM